METTNSQLIERNNAIQEVIEDNEKTLAVCNEELDRINHPEVYGACLCRCNCIVINKERMMTVTTDKRNYTTYEFSPLYPTFFSPDTAKDIAKNDVFKDINDNRIKMEVIGEKEYYTLLKERATKTLELFKTLKVTSK